MPYVRIEDLTFDYGGNRPAVDRVSFDIAKGEFIGLLGPSGCGKSTTLRMFAGLLAPTGGTISIAGRNIVALPPWERNLGLVFQSYALFPHMTVAQNVAFGLKLRKLPAAEVAARVEAALRTVRLESFAARKPSALSGGQQQRVAIARAIVIEPDILLLDEPLSNLDARLRDEMRFELREIQIRTGITTLFVTHDQQEALTMCDRIAVMNTGNLEQIGTPAEIYDRPASRFVADFIGRANSLAGMARADGIHCDGMILPPPPGLKLAGPVIAMLRPHALQVVAPEEGFVRARVLRRIYAGSVIEAALELGNGQHVVAELRAGRAEDDLAQAGHEIGLTWRPADMQVFAA